MYLAERGAPQSVQSSRPPANGRRAVGGTVVALGATSLLTDVSSEMVVAVLPIYLTVALGLSPVAFGVIDGLYQGVTALVRLVGGVAADRSGRPKAVAVIGYSVSAVSKLLLLPASGLLALSAVISFDRSGKGVRTAPRDAMIVAATPPASLGLAFGVHRAMDTAGALAGPLVAFLLLAAVPGGYDVVFVVSFAVAALGVAVLVLLVREPVPPWERSPRSMEPAGERPGFGEVLALARRSGLRRPVVAAGLLSLLTVSDGFIYLVLTSRGDVQSYLVPLLFVATALSYLMLAVPSGRLADRVGRVRVFVAGHVVLVAAYGVVLGPVSGTAAVVVVLGLLGAYYAATDGVLPAVIGPLVPATLTASAIALGQTVVAVGRLVAAFTFGATWTWVGQEAALMGFTVGLTLSCVVAWVLLRAGDDAPAAAR